MLRLRRILVIGLLAALTAACFINIPLMFLHFSFRTLLGRALNNFGHVPLFGLGSVALFALSRRLFGLRLSLSRHYLLALAVAALFGLVTEGLQLCGPRNADPLDMVRNLVGAGGTLGLLATLDQGLDVEQAWRRRSIKLGVRWIAILALLATAAPVALSAEAYRRRATRFPALCRFENRWELAFMRLRGTELELTSAPAGWGKEPGDTVGRLTFSGHPYPALFLQEPYPDWTGYDFLELQLFSEDAEPITFGIRIRDVYKDRRSRSQFAASFVVSPGANRIRFPIDLIRKGPGDRELDLTRIQLIELKPARPRSEVQIYMDDIVLTTGIR